MASHTVSDQAFVTLATNDTYSLGALVLAHSLRQAGTSRQIAIMITAGVSEGMRHQLSTVFDVIAEVNVLDSRDTTNLALLTRPDLGVTFTKLHCWRLTQFTKCVFMDADTMALDNIDELFDREELSAAPDAGWPDCFNSGVFVFRPSLETYQSLLQFAVSHGSFDGGDQGLLNLYFSDWATKDIARHLPFIYNVVSQAFYSYLPAFRQFGKNVKVVHFIGAMKPWHHSYNTGTSQVEPSTDTLHSMDYLQKWWALFMDKVQPFLDPSSVAEQVTNEFGVLKINQMGVVEQMGNLTITSSGGSYSQDQLEDENRRFAWDRGQIDYLGIDSFELIQAKLQSTIGKKPSPPPSEENVVPHGQPKSILKKPDKKEKEEKKPKSAIKRA